MTKKGGGNAGKDKKDDKDFKGPGVEGEKSASAGIITGEQVIKNLRAQGIKV